MTTYVYFIRAVQSGMVKIGVSADPKGRLRTLQPGSHERLELLVAMPGDSDLEEALHRAFTDASRKGEWFHPRKELLHLIEAVKGKRLDLDYPKNAADRIRSRKKKVERDKQTAMATVIQAAADRAGMSPNDWVWNVAMPKVVELALQEAAPSDAVGNLDSPAPAEAYAPNH